MLYFLITLAVGILAVLAVQKADIEGVKTSSASMPTFTTARAAAKRQEDRGRRLALGQLAEQ